MSLQWLTLHFNKYVSFIGFYAHNSFSITRVSRATARTHARTSASCHNRVDGREALGRKIHFSVLHAGVQLAVPRKITKKKRRIDRHNRSTSITFYYTAKPFSLYVPSRGFLSIGVLSLSLSFSFPVNTRADGDSEPRIDKRRVTKDKEEKERERDERIDGEERETKEREQPYRDAEERKARNGNHEKRQRIISIIDPNGRMHVRRHVRTQNAALAYVCALRFIAAPLTGGLRPSKGCACGYVHNTVHRRMHVGSWMRRRARWLRERETSCARERTYVRVCVTFDVAWTTMTAVQRPASRVEIARSRSDDRSFLAFARVKIGDVDEDMKGVNRRSDRYIGFGGLNFASPPTFSSWEIQN